MRAALLASLALTACALAASAQTKPADIALPPEAPAVVSDANAGAAPIAGDRVYRAFHEKAGIDRVVQRLVVLYHADPRLKDIFAAVDDEKIARLLGEQICYVVGGPCHYSGRDMTATHAHMGVQMADFNALVEDLQTAMTGEAVPVWAQNRLLAKLAPMERAVVTR